MASSIDPQCAKTFINAYQKAHPAAVQSLWLDSDIITTIQNLLNQVPPVPLSGIRVYYAKYVVPASDAAGNPCGCGTCKPGDQTVVLALTKDDPQGNHNDIGVYFDYTNPCPPGCNGITINDLY